MAILVPSPTSVREGKWPPSSVIQPEGSSAAQLLVASRLYFTPLWVPEVRVSQTLELELTTSGSGGAPVLRLGAYSPDATGQPGQLLVDAGTVSASVAPGILTLALARTFKHGLVWLACVPQGATVTQPTVRALAGYVRWCTPTTTLIGGANRSGYHQNGVAGALPAAATPVLTVTTAVPLICIRAAA